MLHSFYASKPSVTEGILSHAKIHIVKLYTLPYGQRIPQTRRSNPAMKGQDPLNRHNHQPIANKSPSAKHKKYAHTPNGMRTLNSYGLATSHSYGMAIKKPVGFAPTG
jgi:hypothetical protein